MVTKSSSVPVISQPLTVGEKRMKRRMKEERAKREMREKRAKLTKAVVEVGDG